MKYNHISLNRITNSLLLNAFFVNILFVLIIKCNTKNYENSNLFVSVCLHAKLFQ